MWISPGTWRKASPLNKRLGGRLLLAAVLALALTAGLGAEEEKVFLQKGPKIGKGLEFFGPNAIPYELVEYGYRQKTVLVYLVRRAIPILPSWEKADCAKAPLSLLPAAGGETNKKALLYDSGEDWYAIFVFADEEKASCPFIEVFLDRLRFFLRSGTPSPFPAILDIK